MQISWRDGSADELTERFPVFPAGLLFQLNDPMEKVLRELGSGVGADGSASFESENAWRAEIFMDF